MQPLDCRSAIAAVAPNAASERPSESVARSARCTYLINVPPKPAGSRCSHRAVNNLEFAGFLFPAEGMLVEYFELSSRLHGSVQIALIHPISTQPAHDRRHSWTVPSPFARARSGELIDPLTFSGSAPIYGACTEIRPRALHAASKPEKPSLFHRRVHRRDREGRGRALNKRLPQERLQNKRALDNAARRAAEASGTASKPLRPQAAEARAEQADGRPHRRQGQGQALRRHRHVAQGARSPRPTPSSARPISTASASPSRPASATSRHRPRQPPEPRSAAKAKVPGSAHGRKKVALPGQNLEGAQTVGISATVKALEDIILHGRKEVEGNDRLDAAPPGAARKIRRRNPVQAGDQPTSPPATSPPPSPTSSRASTTARPTRCCSASPARARPSPPRRPSCAPSARR